MKNISSYFAPRPKPARRVGRPVRIIRPGEFDDRLMRPIVGRTQERRDLLSGSSSLSKSANVTSPVRIEHRRSDRQKPASRSAEDSSLRPKVGGADTGESNKHVNVTPLHQSKSQRPVIEKHSSSYFEPRSKPPRRVGQLIKIISPDEFIDRLMRRVESGDKPRRDSLSKSISLNKSANVTSPGYIKSRHSDQTKPGPRGDQDNGLRTRAGVTDKFESNKHVNVTPLHQSKSQRPVIESHSLFVPTGSDLEHDCVATALNPLYLSPAFCDRLTITFNPFKEEKAALQKFATDGGSVAGGAVKIVKRFSGYPATYKEKFEIRLKEEAELLLLIECGPRRRRAGHFRIEFTGRSLRAEYSEIVHLILESAFGGQYKEAISNASITRFDATVDILNSANKLLFVTNRARDMTTWIRRGGADYQSWEVETLCFGSSLSDYQVIIYDKGVERWNTKFDESMSGVRRVEIRFRERERGRCLTVSDFKRLQNPFAPLAIGSFDVRSGRDSCDLFFFLTSVEKYGADGMLQLIKDRQRRSRYRNMLKEAPFLWWKPDELWRQVLDQLQRTNLFPADAF